MNTTELSKNDGRDGQPAYVAVGGVIYDVSASSHWQDGNHEGAHQAGQDLTEALKTAPHVRTVIERFPVIGRLEEPAAAPTGNKSLPVLLIGAAIIIVLTLAFLFF